MMMKIREPETHDITIYTGLTMVLALCVMAAHYFGGYLSVVEWRFSSMIEKLNHLNPWMEAGIAVALVALVSALLIRGRNSLKPYDAEGTAKWDTTQEL